MRKKIYGGAGDAIRHESARLHVTGEASYIDDMVVPRDLVHGAFIVSSCAHARILSIQTRHLKKEPAFRGVILASDIPGQNDVGPIFKNEPLFAENLCEYVSQPLGLVVADSHEEARRLASLVKVEYEPLEPVLSIGRALEKNLQVAPGHTLRRGDLQVAFEKSEKILEGEMKIGGQDHFYLETHVAMAIPGEQSSIRVYSSTQNPSEVQHLVARVLAIDEKDVEVEVRRMGGGFGGKESQASILACAAGIMARKLKRSVKVRLCRDDDMTITGKRHHFEAFYRVGYTKEGKILAMDLKLAAGCGYSADLSTSILDRALFHADNAYWIEACKIEGIACKTHTVSNTAYRGFGGPQGVIVIEKIIDSVARELGRDPLEIRKLNYYGVDKNNVTPYHQTIEDNILEPLTHEILQTSDYEKRRAEIKKFNQSHEFKKRGIAFSPVKFGISFTTAFLNQAGALIHIYKDGSIHLNHGGTEMGQGLFTKIAQVVASEFQVDIEKIRVMATSTAKVPNTSPTAASSGADLNGKAAQIAAREIVKHLKKFASEHFRADISEIIFDNNQILYPGGALAFEEFIHLAYLNRVPLFSAGYYKTPRIHYDRQKAQGRPFFYFCYGTCVSEVEIDLLTGETLLLRTDILHDTGRSLNPDLDLGQIEGGFVQGMGWVTMEELVWDEKGNLRTHAPSTYKIPTSRDIPLDFRVRLFESGYNREDVVFHSKAVGEPPFLHGITVWLAIRDALSSALCGKNPDLNSPATPEEILRSLYAGGWGGICD